MSLLSLQAMQHDLVTQAGSSFSEPAFTSSDGRLAELIAQQSAKLAAESLKIGDEQIQTQLKQVFQSACLDSAGFFQTYFDAQGNPFPCTENTPISMPTGEIAVANLPNSLERLGRAKLLSAKSAIETASITDAIHVVLEALIRHGIVHAREGSDQEFLLLQAIHLRQEEIIDACKDVLWHGDYLQQKDRLREAFRDASEPISSDRTVVLRTGIGLANAAWQMGHFYLSKIRNKPEKLRPEHTHDVFNPYELMMIRLFESSPDSRKGILRSATEIWKDLRQLKKAMANKS